MGAPEDYVEPTEEDMEEEIIIRDDGTSTEGEKEGRGWEGGGRNEQKVTGMKALNITWDGVCLLLGFEGGRGERKC